MLKEAFDQFEDAFDQFEQTLDEQFREMDIAHNYLPTTPPPVVGVFFLPTPCSSSSDESKDMESLPPELESSVSLVPTVTIKPPRMLVFPPPVAGVFFLPTPCSSSSDKSEDMESLPPTLPAVLESSLSLVPTVTIKPPGMLVF
jgi:hypothetical protein